LNGVVVNEKDLTQTRTPEAIKGFRGRDARFGPEFSSFRPIIKKMVRRTPAPPYYPTSDSSRKRSAG
jgi:hypothetical protein